jgi:co-chaperonin GroES (HSP10)
MATGEGYTTTNGVLVPMTIKPGDYVVLISSNPFHLPREGNPELAPEESYCIFQESDVFCKVNTPTTW